MLETGDKVRDYTLVKHIGSGKYGTVWLAEKPIQFADRGVLRALKFLSGQNGKGVDFESVRREVNTWIEASGHSNVVSVIDAFTDSGRFVIVSEYAGDGSLRDWLNNNDNKAPSIEKAVEIMSGILNGLIHLHSLSITHRDLKPENILLHHQTPRIADFGMSRIVDSITHSNTRAGSWLYMSPEATKKSKNPQTDIWSVGVIFYEMLSGQFPFYEEDDFALMEAIRLNEPIALPSQIPLEVRVIVERALQKDLTKRFQTAKEMRLAVEESSFVLKTRKAKLKETIIDADWKDGHTNESPKISLPIKKATPKQIHSKPEKIKNETIKIPDKLTLIENNDWRDLILQLPSNLMRNISGWAERNVDNNMATVISLGCLPVYFVVMVRVATGLALGDCLTTILFLKSLFSTEALSWGIIMSAIITIGIAGLFSYGWSEFLEKFVYKKEPIPILEFIFCFFGFGIGLFTALYILNPPAQFYFHLTFLGGFIGSILGVFLNSLIES